MAARCSCSLLPVQAGNSDSLCQGAQHMPVLVPHTSARAMCLCRVRAEAERKAVNTTIQGTAADIMKVAGWQGWVQCQPLLGAGATWASAFE